MDLPVPRAQVLQLLDGVPVPGAWAGAVSHALDHLWRSAPLEDRTILTPLGYFFAEHALDLASLRAEGSSGGRPPAGSRQTHPVCTALLLLDPKSQFPGMTQLLLILVTAAIEAGTSAPEEQRKRITRLASFIRGASRDKGSPLRLVLEDARSLPKMIMGVDKQRGDGNAQLHQDFDGAWQLWIRSTLVRWIQAEPTRLSALLRPHALVQDIEGANLEIGGGPDTDDQSSIHSDLTEPSSSSKPDFSAAVRRNKAIAEGMTRASGGDLYSPPDQIVPSEIVASLAQAAMKATATALADSLSCEAEGPAALALALATAIREIDLEFVVWGTKASRKSAAIDPNQPQLYRAVCMPPNAVQPGPELIGWLEPSADQVTWPLPPVLHQMLRKLSPTGTPQSGAPVLPLRSIVAADRYHLWSVSRGLAPDIGLAASQARLALAAALTQRFGAEVTQLVLGDTFSTSAAPAYYSAELEGNVVAAVAEIQQTWFGETSRPALETPRTFGSKLVLTNEAAIRWPTQLRQRIRSASHRKEGAETAQWIAHRDHLAGALCAVTAARPTEWLGEINLNQVVPEYGVIVISDKASDMLRRIRIAATGCRWVADLRLYLDRLCRIAEGAETSEAARLAERILRSQAPLFSIPDRDGGPLSVAAFRQTMPLPLQTVPNHYRHRLNHSLQREHLDPELRYAQLGWVVTPAHALADLSPWSARAFGAEMAPVLDRIMVRDGWYPPTQRTANWTWDGVPEQPLKDWAAVAAAHASEHQQNIRRLKAKLVEQWKEVSGDVLDRLAQAVAEYFPSLHLNVETRRLEHHSSVRKPIPVEMTLAHHGVLCDRVRQGDKEPNDATEAIAARILLFRIILSARRRGLVKGPLPSRPVLSVTSDPSPFLPDLGVAVRHAEALRHQLLTRAAEGRANDQGPLVLTSVLAYSAYRHLDLAMAATAAASKASRSHARPDCIRIPAVIDRELIPMAFGGVPALLLARRGYESPTARSPDMEQVGEWIRHALVPPMPVPESNAELVQRVESLFQATGRLELSGPERTIMLGHSSGAAVPVERSVARDDNWPLRTAVGTHTDDQPANLPTYEEEASPSAISLRLSGGRDVANGYARLVAALNPESFPKIIGSTSDSHHGWRGKLEKYLARLHQEFGEHTNLGLLIGFTRHRLRYGGRRKRHLHHASLAWLTRFASDLLAVAGTQSILDWDTGELYANYLAVLIGKPLTARRQAFDALATFHAYLVEVHQAPTIPYAELAAFVGDRVGFVDPGMLTDMEVERVLGELQLDLATELARSDATPEAVRLLELREIMFLILEASGVRPSSGFGLTLGDVLLLGPGRDFVRIHTTGAYGRAKSTAALGFIPLDGSLWQKTRHRVLAWLEREKALLSGAAWWKAPVFAIETGGKRRFNRDYLTRRIDQLLKWVSSNRKARIYWLRKNRITARHERVADLARPMARDAYAEMCASGHTLIQTPLQSYISDPAVTLSRQLREGRHAARADILAVTNLDAAQLDMAWLRTGGAQSPGRLATVLHRLHSMPVTAPSELLTAPPPLNRRQAMMPRHIDAYARALHHHTDRHEALLRTGLSARQAEALDRLAALFISRRGLAPWPLEQLRHKRMLMKPPRHLNGSEKLFKLLDAVPDASAKLLAESYSKQAHISRLHASDVIMELTTVDHVDAACRFLATTGIGLSIETSATTKVVKVSDGMDKGKSHTAAFQWVMTIFWIYGRFLKG